MKQSIDKELIGKTIVLALIEELVKDNSNDTELGAKVRKAMKRAKESRIL